MKRKESATVYFKDTPNWNLLAFVSKNRLNLYVGCPKPKIQETHPYPRWLYPEAKLAARRLKSTITGANLYFTSPLLVHQCLNLAEKGTLSIDYSLFEETR